jgi:hypothetical protein
MHNFFKKYSRWVLIGGSGLVVVITIALFVFLTKNPAKPTESTTTSEGTTSGSQTQPSETVKNLDQDAAAAMIGFGLFQADADGSIQPGLPVSRAEFASLLTVVLKLESNVPEQNSYTDVLPNHPNYADIEAVKYFLGYQKPAEPDDTNTQVNQASQNFRPDLAIKRSEVISAISLALELEPSSSALADAIKLPSDDPILLGSDLPLSRADAARLFYLLIKSQQPTPAASFSVEGVR